MNRPAAGEATIQQLSVASGGSATAAPPAMERGPRPPTVWLLRRWPVILVGLIGGASIGYAVAPKPQVVYESASVVLATRATVPLSNVGGLAQAAFGTSTVIQPVITRLNLKTTPNVLLASKALRAEAVPGTAALRVFGRSTLPTGAVALSNAAATSLATVAGSKGLGTFTVFPAAQAARVKDSSWTAVGVGVGAAAGALGAIVLLFVGFAVRGPILTVEEARREFPAETVLSARIRSGRGGPSSADGEILPHGVVPAVWRAIVPESAPKVPVVCCLLVEGGGRSRRSVRVLEQRIRAHRRLRRQPEGDEAFYTLPWNQPELADVLGVAQVVVAIVAEGARRDFLRSAADEVQVAPGRKQRILVFVR